MLIDEEIRPGRIQEADDEHFTIKFFDGTIETVYYEDLPYLEDRKKFHAGDVIKVRYSHKMIIPELSRPRQGIKKDSSLPDRKLRNKQMMQAIDFKPIEKALSQQIKAEINRISKLMEERK